MAEKLPHLARRNNSAGRERGPGSIEDSRIRGIVEAARRVGAAHVRMGLRANALDMRMQRAHEPHNRNDNRFVGGGRHDTSIEGLKRPASHPGNDYKDVSRFANDWLWHLQGQLKALDAPMAFTPATSEDSKTLLGSSTKTGSNEGQLSFGPTIIRGRRLGAISSPELMSFERSTRSLKGAIVSETTRASLKGQTGANGLSRSIESIRIKPSLTRDPRVILQLGKIRRGLDTKTGTLRPVVGSKPFILAKTADRTGLLLRSSFQAGSHGQASSRDGIAAATGRSDRLSASGIGRNFFERRDGRVIPDLSDAPRLLSRRLEKGTSAANTHTHWREQSSGSRALTELATNRSRTGSVRRVTSDKLAQPIVVNFSPTIVIHSGEGFAGIENAVVQALRQHSHELVRVIGRELQTQRRTAF